MPSPYSSTEISQTGDPTMGQAGVQNPNINDNLFAASYPGAPGRAADSSIPGGGSDLASQGLAKLQQGDQYGGIMTLLDAAQQNPQSVQSQAFLQQLQIVENQPAATTNNGGDSSQFSPPSDSPAYGTMSDTTAMQTPMSGAGATDANAIANQALSVAQSNPAEGILGLMQASTQNPDLLNNQNFLTTMSEVLPQGPGAQTQQSMDASQMQQPQTQPMDASQYSQMPSDASNTQPVTDNTQQAGGRYTLPAQLTSSGDPNIEAGVKQAFQLIQSGDQFDGARILMMIAKADPSILQDQAFIKNLVDLESAVKAGGVNAATDQSALSQTGQAQYDANGNPIDANGNPINQQVDASSNPISQPGTQQMVDASGNPASTDSQTMPYSQNGTQGMTGMSVPYDSSSQVASGTDPSVGAPTG